MKYRFSLVDRDRSNISLGCFMMTVVSISALHIIGTLVPGLYAIISLLVLMLISCILGIQAGLNLNYNHYVKLLEVLSKRDGPA